MDSNYASTTAAGGRVVHGMLAASFISTLVGVKIPGQGALWNDFQINWRKMIRIGDSVKFTATISSVNKAIDTITLDIKGVGLYNDLLYLNGTAKVALMSKTTIKSPLNLTGKRILITGATGILGSSICQNLTNHGAKLILWGRNVDKLKELKSALPNSIVETVSCDFLNEKEVSKNSENIFSNFDIDGIVHTAAAPLTLSGVVSSENLKEMKKHMEVEVFSLHKLVTDFVNNRSDKDGFIITVLTEAVFDSPPANMSAYISAKMASWGLMKCYAQELAILGIRCNSVSPGLMDTPYSSEISIRAKKIEEATNPMRRMCTPEDVAQSVVFLATSGFINGVNLSVTGGQRMP